MPKVKEKLCSDLVLELTRFEESIILYMEISQGKGSNTLYGSVMFNRYV